MHTNLESVDSVLEENTKRDCHRAIRALAAKLVDGAHKFAKLARVKTGVHCRKDSVTFSAKATDITKGK
jgi:hypothetical protein